MTIENNGGYEVLNFLKTKQEAEQKEAEQKIETKIIIDPDWLRLDNDALFVDFGSIRI